MNKPISSGISQQGLTEEQVVESREKYGDNVLTPPRQVSLLKLYLEKFQDPIIQILLVAALVSLVLAFVENDFIETIGIILAVFIATTVGFYFERDAAKKFRVLTAINEDQPVKVRRAGKVMEISRRDVVVGDIILVEVGDEIPADGELIEAVNLQVDESSLTGEPLADKAAETHVPSPEEEQAGDARTESSASGDHAAYPPHVILRSSMVMNGHAEAVVTHVGDHTEIGKVATRSTEKTETKTPLNIQLDKLAKLISKIGTGVSVAAFVIFLVHDIFTNSLWQGNDYFGMAQVVLNYFMMAVTLIVMAVPEGLPMAVTLALALNMRRMLKSNNLVRKLHASETMGAVTVICTDKTGTLTQNKMTVKEYIADPQTDIADLCQAIAANTTAYLDEGKGVGNPTEVALLQWVDAQGGDYLRVRQSADITDQLPFSTENKYMMTIVGHRRLYVKGAPEIILDMCALTDDERQDLLSRIATYQRAGMRVLVLAAADSSVFQYSGLTFQAAFAIEDPVREDVPSAVGICRQAGIEVKVVTGDNSATAIEIARQIGVWDKSLSPALPEREGSTHRQEPNADPRHITGPDFAALTDEEAYECVRDLRVMSRARPTDKQRLVQLLQKRGEVVAVTGDGTNDAPALNYAHVGLSLGSGTSVAKQASDITLMDDSFHSISSAVMWGRSLYKNIQRFLFFQLVVNLSALLLVLGGSFIGTEMPLTVTQILWVNLIMDTFAAMALASLPPSREVMKEQPRSQTDFIISKPMGWGIISCGLLFFAVMFVFLIWCERHGTGSVVDVHELTLFFTTFVMIHFWNLFNAKCFGSQHSAFRYLWRDRGLLLVLLLVLLGQWIIVTFGGRMFRTQPLSWSEWGIIVGITGVFVLGGGELWRLFKRLTDR